MTTPPPFIRSAQEIYTLAFDVQEKGPERSALVAEVANALEVAAALLLSRYLALPEEFIRLADLLECRLLEPVFTQGLAELIHEEEQTFGSAL